MTGRIIVTMICDVCRNKNYYFDTGKKRLEKLVLSKFCKNCRKHTEHKETK